MMAKRGGVVGVMLVLAACGGGVQDAENDDAFASDEEALTSCPSVELVATRKNGRGWRDEAEVSFSSAVRMKVPDRNAVSADGDVESATVAWWNGRGIGACHYRLDDDRRGRKDKKPKVVCTGGTAPGQEFSATRVWFHVERNNNRRGTAKVTIARVCSGGPTTPPTDPPPPVDKCANLTREQLDDGNPCTVDACVPATGPIHTAVAAGTSCDDDNVCNGEATCNANATCVAGAAPELDDGDPCTLDLCDPETGVSHGLAPAGTSCGVVDHCNGSDVCDTQGFCVQTPRADVDDFNPCTVDSCDPATGVSHEPAAAGTACGEDDGNACNGTNACDGAGSCTYVPPGAPPDDGNPCTFEYCDATVGVVTFSMPEGSFCGVPDACLGSPICDANANCVMVPPEFPECG